MTKTTQQQKSTWKDKRYVFGDSEKPTVISVEQVIVIELKNGKKFQFALRDVENASKKLFLFKNFTNKDNKTCSFLLGQVLSKDESNKSWEAQAFDAYEADLKRRASQSKKDNK